MGPLIMTTGKDTLPTLPIPADDTEELNRKLQAFLKSFEDDKRNNNTIANVRLEIHQFQSRMKRAESKIESLMQDRENIHERIEGHDFRLDAHGTALIQIKRRLRTDEHDAEMTTGNFDISAIQREIEENRQKRLNSERAKAEETQWWKRTIIMWVAAALGFVAVTTITILITMAIANSSQHQVPSTTSGQK